jgi:penicillin amidase
MVRIVRGLAIVVGIMVLLLLLATGSFRWLLQASFPQTRGTLSVNGLQAPVQVLRDRYGVPHIRAANMHDLYFAQGFVTAQDRFWQMEFWRRIGSGRLSEFFGAKTLSTDMFLRTAGFQRAAEADLQALNSEYREILQAYADGVNAYVAGKKPRQLGVEFALLKLQGVPVTIEPWTPVNSLTWLKLMALDLGANMRKELYTIDMIQSLGLEETEDFLANYRYDQMPVIVLDSELPVSLLKKTASELIPVSGSAARALPPNITNEQLSALKGLSTQLVGGFDPESSLAFGTGPGVGSNNWVIAGSRTASGKPILANDPHLGIQMPSIWYEVDLYCSASEAQPGKQAGGPYHVRGFSFPGDPGVIIGHNDRIAWGVTNANPDVQQLFIEHINSQNPNQYEVNGRWVDMKVIREEIKVHGQDEPAVLLVRQTRHGPIITDQGAYSGYKGFALNPTGNFPMSLSLSALSMKWTAFMPNRTFQSVIQLNEARNFSEFRDALSSWDIPSQNFVYADVDGNIGYQMPGLIPIRKKGDGSLPSPGWVDDYEWTGFVPFNELPYCFNPPKGYVASANNPVTSERYRYFLSRDFDYGYRALRIVEMITGVSSKVTVADVKKMQGDVLNIFAEEIISYLKNLSLSGAEQTAREILFAWDDRMDPKSAGAAVYAYFWQSLLELSFENKFPRTLWVPEALLEDNSRQINAIAVMLKDPHHPLWEDPRARDVHRSRDDVLKLALQKAVKVGMRAQGRDLKKWSWGKAHTAEFRNMTFGESGISFIQKIFNRGPYPVAGGFQQVFCSDWKADRPFTVADVSSMRQIIDLSDLSRSVTIHTTGQSGHPGSRHYDDMIDFWRNVQYHPTLWDSVSLKASNPETLFLNPR